MAVNDCNRHEDAVEDEEDDRDRAHHLIQYTRWLRPGQTNLLNQKIKTRFSISPNEEEERVAPITCWYVFILVPLYRVDAIVGMQDDDKIILT